MRWLFLASALAACAAPAVAPPTPVAIAAPQDACRMPWARLKAAAPPSIRLTEVEQRESFLKGFNAIPPESDQTADQIFIAHKGEVARIFFVTDGCVTNVGEISWADALKLIGQDI